MPSEINKVAVIGTGVIGTGWIIRMLAHNKKVTAFDLNGSISRKVNGGNLKTFTTKNSAFDCSPFQHHFKDIKSPYATSVEVGKDQDNQAWGGTCCNYGKVGWTYIWQKAGGYCTFSTYITDTEMVYDEVKWSD